MEKKKERIEMAVNVKEVARGMQDQIVAWRRELHQIPELRNETFETEKIIVRELKKMGIEEIQSGIGGSGVVAIIRGAKPGKCLGIRADCDGLPIREETGLPFASTNGNMHACGHDAHTAMALATAKILYENRSELAGTVKMVFQPYEEGDGGAKAMIADGVMENPHIDAMIALHTGSLAPELKSGEIGWAARDMSFNITAFWAKFHGKGAHVATPHEGVDPIFMAASAITQMQAILSRERNPSKTVIAAVCKIEAGVRNNIIPETCYVEGSLRSDNKADQKFYYQRICDIFQSVAQGLRGSVEVGKVFDLMSTETNPDMLNRFLRVVPAVLEEGQLREITTVNPTGEDFARFADLVPSLYFLHGATFGDERDYPHHHPKFMLNESGFWTGTATMVQFALHWLDEP
ncbi:MAG: M20 metallopeptidase family protein [Lawsonibacter sp.]